MSITAYDFQKQFLDGQSGRTIYSVLTESLSEYFFSHLHNTEISHLEFPILVDHLQEFLAWFSNTYNGTDISMGYADYYKILSKTNSDVQSFTWNILYSISIYYHGSSELQAISSALLNGKPLCKFLVSTRNTIAEINSIKPSEVYMDILEIQPKNLHLYFSAIFSKKSVLKMPLLKNLSQGPQVMAADLAKVVVTDWLNGQGYVAKHHAKAQELSLNNLPFAKMSKAKESKAAEKDITKMSVKNLDYRKTMSTGATSKSNSSKKNALTQGDLVKVSSDLKRQANYIRSATSTAELGIVGTTGCMQTVVGEYNKMYDWFNDFDDKFFELFYKIKGSKAGGKFDVKDKDVKKFKDFQRGVSKKLLFDEMGGVSEDCGFDGVRVSAFNIERSPIK